MYTTIGVRSSSLLFFGVLRERRELRTDRCADESRAGEELRPLTKTTVRCLTANLFPDEFMDPRECETNEFTCIRHAS